MAEDVNSMLEQIELTMMEKLEKFKRELSTLRTGRANPQLLDNVFVEYYGARVPLKQVAAISIPEGRTLEIRPWDKLAVDAIEAELRKLDLGAAPVKNGDVIRINLPTMTEEQRRKMVKVVHSMCEDARVSVRNVRREAIEKVKKAEKAKEITEDDTERHEATIQKMTDAYIKNIDDAGVSKEKDLLTV
ncbi:MAG: ribosome recycling factor [Elusimicrobia bacterium RIFOXYA12_FULL_51_18]|nr:MAG: ribosome recycling factor [Elusimicrobia bacterium RIFOXYA12_FULL_51_18]OGS29555.1 MAG: ribosome recycling factor [Elusimicrobia bacterium RIFOXYA2_FULL_53_38]